MAGLARGWQAGTFAAAKVYPAHATTNSAHGVTDIQKIRPALPGALLDQADLQPVFAERKPHEPGMRTERMVEQGEHAIC